MMRLLIASALAVTLLTACQPQTTQPRAAAEPPPRQDTDGVIARFAQDIWPAVTGYRYHGQGGPDSHKYFAVVDPDAGPALHEKVIALGVVTATDQVTDSFPDQDGLQLASTSLTALSVPTASVDVCYTYSAVYYPDGGKNPATRPGASEATFVLHKTDNWRLLDIINDHVVPGCKASDKA